MEAICWTVCQLATRWHPLAWDGLKTAPERTWGGFVIGQGGHHWLPPWPAWGRCPGSTLQNFQERTELPDLARILCKHGIGRGVAGAQQLWPLAGVGRYTRTDYSKPTTAQRAGSTRHRSCKPKRFQYTSKCYSVAFGHASPTGTAGKQWWQVLKTP